MILREITPIQTLMLMNRTNGLLSSTLTMLRTLSWHSSKSSRKLPKSRLLMSFCKFRALITFRNRWNKLWTYRTKGIYCSNQQQCKFRPQFRKDRRMISLNFPLLQALLRETPPKKPRTGWTKTMRQAFLRMFLMQLSLSKGLSRNRKKPMKI